MLDRAAKARGFDCAFQCCEHLNRALVVERAHGGEVRLWRSSAPFRSRKAGGSLATAAWRRMENPVLVESDVEADAGLDVGLTLIGMHLRARGGARCASPAQIRSAARLVTAARTRPKLIGGERAKYSE